MPKSAERVCSMAGLAAVAVLALAGCGPAPWLSRGSAVECVAGGEDCDGDAERAFSTCRPAGASGPCVPVEYRTSDGQTFGCSCDGDDDCRAALQQVRAWCQGSTDRTTGRSDPDDEELTPDPDREWDCEELCAKDPDHDECVDGACADEGRPSVDPEDGRGGGASSTCRVYGQRLCECFMEAGEGIGDECDPEAWAAECERDYSECPEFFECEAATCGRDGCPTC